MNNNDRSAKDTIALSVIHVNQRKQLKKRLDDERKEFDRQVTKQREDIAARQAAERQVLDGRVNMRKTQMVQRQKTAMRDLMLQQARDIVGDAAPSIPKHLMELAFEVKEKEDCAICLEKLGPLQSMVQQCGHSFHSECILAHFKVHSFCPVCRVRADAESAYKREVSSSSSSDSLPSPKPLKRSRSLFSDDEANSDVEILPPPPKLARGSQPDLSGLTSSDEE